MFSWLTVFCLAKNARYAGVLISYRAPALHKTCLVEQKQNIVVTELTLANMQNTTISLTKIEKEDRTADGNLTTAARERTLQSIRRHLKHAGYANISEIAALLGLSHPTARNLIREVVQEWRTDEEDETVVQIQWYRSLLRELQEYPENFDKNALAVLKFQTALMAKVHGLQKLLLQASRMKK